ncbi:MAG: glycine betaine/L-proline ABC transporter ATP-binding protein [Bacteroidales bacterium]|nr:glycine betaine/L-proline ABC transporter ATP-binding protein [Bacteroidales bacterium]MCF8338000.1 glycine betaine/L-proline ABC transporter ATP-binding protein [Bacteroidales bacterium]
MEDNTRIRIEDLSVIFGRRKKDAKKLLQQNKSKEEILKETGCTVAVNKVNFNIQEGEIFVVMGLSGSGKSTLIRCINRLLVPTEGKVVVDEDDILNADESRLRELRRKKFGMVFQNFGLLPHRTVASNVAFGLEIQGMSEEERTKKAYDVIKTVGLQGYEEKMTGQLSGGMQQRVGLARALANDPPVLLMDEAFSALDPLIRANMQDELLDLQERVQKTIVFITHDLDEALKLGDRIAIMKEGFIVQNGTPEEILTNPADDYVKAFVEGVDRSDIVTAGTIMIENPTFVDGKKDGAEMILRKMNQAGVNILPVVDEKDHFMGFVTDQDTSRLRKKEVKTIRDIIHDHSASVYEDATVAEIIPIFRDTSFPIAVVSKDNKLKGLVVHSAVVKEVVGREEKEIEQIIKEGYDI